MLYRIYTENKNYDFIVETVSLYFDGFTIIKTEGYWKGQPEHGLVREIITGKDSDISKVYDLAWDIRKMNEQQAVLVYAIDGKEKLIQ